MISGEPTRCATCSNSAKDQWWWCIKCLYCDKFICNSVVDRRPKEGTSSCCFIRHTVEHHPEKVQP